MKAAIATSVDRNSRYFNSARPYVSNMYLGRRPPDVVRPRMQHPREIRNEQLNQPPPTTS